MAAATIQKRYRVLRIDGREKFSEETSTDWIKYTFRHKGQPASKFGYVVLNQSILFCYYSIIIVMEYRLGHLTRMMKSRTNTGILNPSMLFIEWHDQKRRFRCSKLDNGCGTSETSLLIVPFNKQHARVQNTSVGSAFYHNNSC